VLEHGACSLPKARATRRGRRAGGAAACERHSPLGATSRPRRAEATRGGPRRPKAARGGLSRHRGRAWAAACWRAPAVGLGCTTVGAGVHCGRLF
jgi:hypothetical protein